MKNSTEPTKQDKIILKQADAFYDADIERTPKAVADFLAYHFINMGHDTEDFNDQLLECVEGIAEYCYAKE